MTLDRRGFLAAAAAAPALGCAAAPSAFGRGTAEVDTSGAFAEVDLGRLARNLARVRERARGRKVMAVVKANAYGHGLVEVARLLESKGADALMVASLREAEALRDAGVNAPVLVFGPAPASGLRTLVERGIAQAVFDGEARALSEAAVALGRKALVHVLVDTGLGRLGVQHDRALPFLAEVARLPGLRIEGIMTDLVEDPDLDREQLGRFLRICEDARRQGIDVGQRHAASSDALASRGEEFLLDMVRPGILLYGHQPSEAELSKRTVAVEPVLALKAKVAQVKTLAAGDAVSYHRAFVASGPTRVATLPIGYALGLPTTLAGKGSVLVAGRRHPLVAAVTANHAIVHLQGDAGETGGEAVLFGEQQGEVLGAETVAASAGVSVYRLLIGLSPELPRVYREDRAT